MASKIISAFILLSFLFITGCAGGGGYSRAYYGHRYGPDPLLYRGGYVRDRAHVVSEGEIKALEEADAATMPATPAPDMGMGDMDMGGMDMGGMDMDMDMGGFD